MDDAVVIRVARLDEYDSLAQLMRRAALTIPEFHDQLIANPEVTHLPRERVRSGQALVAESGATTAGFAVWIPIGERTAELYGMFVDPLFRHQGVGVALLEATLQNARQEGHKRLLVVANPGSEEYYRRHGFVRTGATATQLGPAVTLLMEIPE